MVPWKTMSIILASICGVSDAYACRGQHSHRYVFLSSPPAKPPQGAITLEVRVDDLSDQVLQNPKSEVEAEILDIRVSEGRKKPKVPSKILIQPLSQVKSSCDHWAVADEKLFVVGYLNWNDKGNIVLDPIRFRAKQYRTAKEEGISEAE